MNHKRALMHRDKTKWKTTYRRGDPLWYFALLRRAKYRLRLLCPGDARRAQASEADW
jgi:hypothetical protein